MLLLTPLLKHIMHSLTEAACTALPTSHPSLSTPVRSHRNTRCHQQQLAAVRSLSWEIKSFRFQTQNRSPTQSRTNQLSFSFCRTTTSSAQTMSGVLVSTTTCPETAQSSCEANAYRNGQGVDGFTEGSLEYRTVTWLRLRLPA